MSKYYSSSIAFGAKQTKTERVVVSPTKIGDVTTDAVSGALTVDEVPTLDSLNPVSSDGVARAVIQAGAELPTRSSEDTGKVLTVKNSDGDLEWDTPEGGIPDMTGKNGKVLGAVDNNGTMEAQWVDQPTVPTLATVATTGSYDDLINKPLIPAAQVNADWNSSSGVSEILNKPNLAAVATSGSYADLTNKPSIPAAQVNADWNSVSGVSQILNKPNLATVATSGSYADLSNKPTIPTVPTTDQTYNASSTNPQSGVAVAQAIAAIPSATYTAGDGIDITSDVVSAKAGTGLSIGTSTKTEPVTEPKYAAAVTSGSLIVVDCAIPLTSDIITAIDNNETITVVVPQYVDPTTTIATWFQNTNRFVIGAHNNDSGKRAPLSAPAASYYGTFTLNKSNIPSDYLSNWDAVKASNTTMLEIMGCTSSSFNGWPGSAQVSSLGDYKVFDITMSKTATIQNAINVDNPLPASTSADEDKVLTVNSQGAPEWATAQGGPAYTAGVGIDITAGVVSADIDNVTIKQAATQTVLEYEDNIRQSQSGGYGVISLGLEVTSKLGSGSSFVGKTMTIHIPGNTFRYLSSGDQTSAHNVYLELNKNNGEFGSTSATSMYGTPLVTAYDSTHNYTYIAEQDFVVSCNMGDWANYASLDPASAGGAYYFGFGASSSLFPSSQLYATVNGTDTIASPVVISETVTSNKIAVANPLPAYDTTTDVGKVLTVTANGLAWVSPT